MSHSNTTGQVFVYTGNEAAGVLVLAIAATISLLSVITVFVAVLLNTYRADGLFLRTQLGAYFMSLLLGEAIQATGSLMSVRWVMYGAIEHGVFCSTQGALKNAGNVSTALWTAVIAVHTFTLVFLKQRVPSWVFYTTICATWALVGLIVLIGPAAIQNATRGPFWGISGLWCWISPPYSVPRFMMEYFFMLIAAVISIVLYGLISLRLRGNIEGSGLRFKFCQVRVPWTGESGLGDLQIERVGKQMLLYPCIYVLLLIPIAACRWSEIFGRHVPPGAEIFADTLFILSGLVNAVLYSTTRRVAPIKPLIPSFSRPLRKSSKDSQYTSALTSGVLDGKDSDPMAFATSGNTTSLNSPTSVAPFDLERAAEEGTAPEDPEIGVHIITPLRLNTMLESRSITASPESTNYRVPDHDVDAPTNPFGNEFSPLTPTVERRRLSV